MMIYYENWHELKVSVVLQKENSTVEHNIMWHQEISMVALDTAESRSLIKRPKAESLFNSAKSGKVYHSP